MKRLVIAAMAAGAGLALAPLAQADQTVTVQQACGMLQVGTQPYSYGDKHIACVTPEQYTVGEFPEDTNALHNEMQTRFPGSHTVDPNNPWSDWVIPDPATQTGVPGQHSELTQGEVPGQAQGEVPGQNPADLPQTDPPLNPGI